MKFFTRPQIKEMIQEQIKLYEGIGYTKRLFLKDWAESNDIYYHGLVRFLKGSEITIATYSKIMNAIDPSQYPEVKHYLAQKLNYSDLKDIDSLIDQLYKLSQ